MRHPERKILGLEKNVTFEIILSMGGRGFFGRLDGYLVGTLFTPGQPVVDPSDGVGGGRGDARYGCVGAVSVLWVLGHPVDDLEGSCKACCQLATLRDKSNLKDIYQSAHN